MTMDWHQMIQALRSTLDRSNSNLHEGEGFALRLYSHYGLRYYEGGRELTLLTEAVDATDRHGRTWFILPTYETQVFVPSSLEWDDGGPLTEEEAALVIQRICRTLEKRKGFPQVVDGDKVYEQIWIDTQQVAKQDSQD